ncbi:MAG: rhodanese-like domain-containing protein, partial [Flavobacteriaceae bacterium]
MKSCIITFICLILSCAQDTTIKVELLAPLAFEEKISEDNVQLVDVRTPEEWQDGIINHAKTINYFDDSFKMQLKELDKTKPVAVYCKSGGRSGKTAKLLSELGFKEIYDLKGGYLNWIT